MTPKEENENFYNEYWAQGRSKYKYRYGVFLSWIKPGSKVLDLGCGDGYLANLIAEKNYCDVTCADVSEVALNIAKARGLKVIKASIDEPLPFPENSFDYVIATEVLEHIIKTESALSEMARVSKKYLLVSIPNIAYWEHRLRLVLGRFPKQWVFHPMEHLRYWSVADFKDTLKGLNLEPAVIKGGSGKRYLRDVWPNLFAEQICFKIEK